MQREKKKNAEWLEMVIGAGDGGGWGAFLPACPLGRWTKKKPQGFDWRISGKGCKLNACSRIFLPLAKRNVGKKRKNNVSPKEAPR
jgi:hypothetical protein